MRLAFGLGLLLVAVLSVAAVAPLFRQTDHTTFAWVVAAAGVVVFASCFFGARLTYAAIRAAAERQADAIRRM